MITVARFTFAYEAWLARGLLESEGIPAWLADEHTITMNWLYSNALGGVRLQVPESYQADAVQVLNSVSPVSEEEPSGCSCPYCGSQKTHLELSGKRWAFLVFTLIQFPLFPVAQFRQCDQCLRSFGKAWLIPGVARRATPENTT